MVFLILGHACGGEQVSTKDGHFVGKGRRRPVRQIAYPVGVESFSLRRKLGWRRHYLPVLEAGRCVRGRGL